MGAHRTAQVAAGIVAVLAAFVLCGWLIGPAWATRLAAGLPTMKFNTALCLLLLAVGLLVGRRVVAIATAAAVFLIAAATVVEIAVGQRWLDELVVVDRVSRGGRPGQMATATALCLLALAACQLWPQTRVGRVAAQLVAVAVLATGLTATVTYMYGPRALFELAAFSTVAVHTAIALILLAVAVLATVPAGAVEWALTHDTTRAVLIRWLVPSAFVVLPAIGLLVLVGERSGLYSPEFGQVVALAATAVLLGVSGLFAGRVLTRSEARATWVVESMPVGFVRVARNGRVAALNAQATRLLGLGDAPAVGGALADLMPAGSARAVEDARRRLSRGAPVETVQVHRPGSPEVWCEATLHATDLGADLYLVDVTATHLANDLSRRAAENDHRVAETLQSALLAPLPAVEDMVLAARYLTASGRERVGGDWYDAVVQSDGTVSVSIGDVSGHGIAAASAMGQLRAMMRALEWDAADPPSGTLAQLDRVLLGAQPGVSATVIAARLRRCEEPDAGWRLAWSNAGHPPPVVVHPDGAARTLGRSADLMLGDRRGAERRNHVAVLPAGSLLVLFTDGLVATHGNDIDAGIEELRAALATQPTHDLEHVLDTMIEPRRAQHRDDDLAILAIRLDAAPVIAAVNLQFENAASGHARAFVRAHTEGIQAEHVDDLLVIVSELVTNALMHGLPPLILRLTTEFDGIRVAIVDAAATRPPAGGSAADHNQSHGRGLTIVNALSERWGVAPDGPTGKAVWAWVGITRDGTPNS